MIGIGVRGNTALDDLHVLGIPTGMRQQTGRPMGMHGVWRIHLAVLDAALAVVAVVVITVLRFGGHPGLLYAAAAAVLPVVWSATLGVAGAYDRRFLSVGAEEFRRILNAGLWLFALTASGSFITHADLSRTVVGLAVPAATVGTLMGRACMRRVLHRRLAAGVALHRVVVAGERGEVADLVEHLTTSRHAGLVVVGACCPGAPAPIVGSQGHIAVVDGVDAVKEVATTLGADTIAIAGPAGLGPGALRRLSWDLEGSGVDLVVAPAITELAGPRLVVRPVNGLPLLHVEEPDFHGCQRLVKDLLERVIAAGILILSVPLLAAAALAVRLSSRGPALFRQVRLGRFGRPFTVYKFRTMRADAEQQRAAYEHLNELAGPLFKIRRDPRVTPVGRWLRRFSVDELPQLWNVLTGSMSLVGPRPPLPQEVAAYDPEVRRRLLVKPGMTGLWQVSGRSDLSWNESVRLDLFYVENWSVALDCVLLLRTVGTVLAGRGAY